MIKHLCSSISYGGAASLAELRELFWARSAAIPDQAVGVGEEGVVREVTRWR